MLVANNETSFFINYVCELFNNESRIFNRKQLQTVTTPVI